MDPVVVVGAGPVGLTAALLLARSDIPVVVLERRTAPYALPRAVHLDAPAMAVLARAGIDLPTRPGLGLRLLDAAHRTVVEFPRSPLPGPLGFPAANMLHQPDLDALLLAAASAHTLVSLRTGCEVVDLVQDSCVHLVLSSGSSVRASAVLGCDGAGSTVRSLIGSSLHDLGRADRWLVVDAVCPTPLGTWDGVHQVCDPAQPATFMQVTDDRYRWEFRLGGDALDVPALLAAWSPPADLTVVRTADYTYRACIADRWRDRRVLLLGDAAHQTPPFIGQGLGQGLLDAACAASLLTSTSSLADLQRLREPVVRAQIRKALLVGIALTGGSGPVAGVRGGAFALARRAPALVARALDR